MQKPPNRVSTGVTPPGVGKISVMWTGLSLIQRGATVAAAVSAAVLPNIYQGDQLGVKVGIVGDSITCLSAKYLQDDFQSKYAYQISCKNGITIAEGTPAAVKIDKSLEGAPSVIIVNLGTNDALKDKHDSGQQDLNDIGTAWKALDALAADLSNVPCVIWVSVSQVPDVYGSNVGRGINEWIHNRATSVPGNFEINWWGLLKTGNNALAWLSPVDGVHTTQIGQQELASLYLQAVQNDCAQVGLVANP
jgi:lysophospholipase L1-like esterase